jgi:pimeloyl-ACP methyl ester carboxylesterase
MNKQFTSGYATVNGLQMYYEVYGQGKPLVLIHGGGSTIQTSFSNIIPLLSAHRQVIGVELQAHGRTGDRNAALSFEQDADDVTALLTHLGIAKADFLGFSNGGQTVIEIALRHAGRVNKLIIASAFYKRAAAPAQFWEGFEHAHIEMLPPDLKEGFLQVNNDKAALENMFWKDVQRMKTFRDWTDDQVKSIQRPTLIINGNQDVGSIEHALEMHRNIAGSVLAVLPGGHGDYLGTAETMNGEVRSRFNAAALIEDYLHRA